MTETNILLNNVKGINLVKLKFIVEYLGSREIITLDFNYNDLIEENMVTKEAYSFINLTPLLERILSSHENINIYYIDYDQPLIVNEKFLNHKQMISFHYVQLIDRDVIHPVIRCSQLIHNESTIYDLFKGSKEYYLIGSPIFVVEGENLHFIGMTNEFKDYYINYVTSRLLSFA